MQWDNQIQILSNVQIPYDAKCFFFKHCKKNRCGFVCQDKCVPWLQSYFGVTFKATDRYPRPRGTGPSNHPRATNRSHVSRKRWANGPVSELHFGSRPCPSPKYTGRTEKQEGKDSFLTCACPGSCHSDISGNTGRGKTGQGEKYFRQGLGKVWQRPNGSALMGSSAHA